MGDYKVYKNIVHFLFVGTLKFYAINRNREALKQFVDGLKCCNVYDYLIKYPMLFKNPMCDNSEKLTAQIIEDIFEIVYSSVGSNSRRLENKAITYFRDYLLDCEGMYIFKCIENVFL